MKQQLLIAISILLVATSCSSGYRAYKKGDYYKAAFDAVDHLKSSPNSDKAEFVLTKTYPLALQMAQREIEKAKLNNSPNNYEDVVYHYEKINQLADNIYRTPAANRVIAKPTEFPAELSEARKVAAGQVYEIRM